MRRSSPRVLAAIRGRLGAYAVPLGELAEKILARMAGRVGLNPRHEISLLLTDNPTIRQLNSRWRGIDRPTDVLSFPLHVLKPGVPPPAGAAGDIVISLPYARRAADQEGIWLEYHLARLLAHGLLHLLGHDHDRPLSARRMEREERGLLAKEFPNEG